MLRASCEEIALSKGSLLEILSTFWASYCKPSCFVGLQYARILVKRGAPIWAHPAPVVGKGQGAAHRAPLARLPTIIGPPQWQTA